METDNNDQQKGQVLRIILPWPARGLHPNARMHWAPKAKLTKAARALASEAAREAREAVGLGDWAERGEIPITVTFLPPDKRPRDLDGLLSQSKAYLDGVADSLGVNDRRFRPSLQLGAVVKGGRVAVDVAYFGLGGAIEREDGFEVGGSTPEWLKGL